MHILKQRERILASIALIGCVFLLPTYVTLIIGVLFTFRYHRYIEFPIAAFLIDVLYRPYGHTIVGLFGWSLIFVVTVDYFRNRIKQRGKDTL